MTDISHEPGRKKTALVVDDSKLARYVLKEMLIEQDIKVETAESAEEALGSLSAYKPDVIFMDHMMPGMDGFQAVQAIKADPKTAMIPILMYTSKDSGVYIGQAQALGAVGVLPKKLKPVQLEKVLLDLKLIASKEEPEIISEPTPDIDIDAAQAISDAVADGSNHSLEDLALSASEELEKDSMRLLFRQLFVEQRDCIKQDQFELVDAMADKVAPEIIAARKTIPVWQMLSFAALGLLFVALMLPVYGIVDINADDQSNVTAQITEQTALLTELQQKIQSLESISEPQLNLAKQV